MSLQTTAPPSGVPTAGTPAFLEFEKSLLRIQHDIDEMEREQREGGRELAEDIVQQRVRFQTTIKRLYGNLTPWETVLVARHPKRPLVPDYIRMIFQDVCELHGDRTFGDDHAVKINVNDDTSAGDNNTFTLFNDTLTAGTGDNTLVGDVYYDNGDERVLIDVVNSYYGEDNTFKLFNDTMTGGAGDNHMVGDVYFDNALGISSIQQTVITVSNFGGDNNTFSAFNDTMTSLDGTDIMVGDVYQVGGGNSVDITVSNAGGSDNNMFHMFNDELTSGDGEDTLIGDVWRDGGVNVFDHGSAAFAIDIHVSNAAGGDDNTFDMFNDTLIAGEGNDLLVGDLYYKDTEDNGDGMHISLTDNGSDNTWTMFGDTIDGGAGDDEIWGDFLFASDGELELDLDGLALGTDDLFNDTIDGGANDDDIWGQLGDDILTGGTGADTFHYGTTLSGASSGVGGISGGIFDGEDTILDYSIADDTVDLEALFDVLEALDGAGFAETAERLAALDYSDAGDGELKLTINDGAGEANGATGDFSITFDNLLFTDFNTQLEQDALEATFILGGV